jgi:type IV secretion system protein TrbI
MFKFFRQPPPPAADDEAKIYNAAPLPAGVVPRHLQTIVLVGLAVVMILVIAFSGSRTPPARKTMPETPPSTPPSQTEIREFQRGIEEHTRRLQLEQAELSRAKEEAQIVQAGGGGQMAAPLGREPYRRYEPAAPSYAGDAPAPPKRNESLFASNIALSLRTPAAAKTRPVVEPLEETRHEFPTAGDDDPALDDGAEDAHGLTPVTDPVDKKVKPSHAGINRHAGKSYRLFEGTVLEAVLLNRLDGGFSGPVNAMVTTHVYSHNRQRLLIPQGTKLVGAVKPVQAFAQQRLALSFHRLIMPDGFNVDLDQFQGLNQIGETGLRDRVNNHYLQLFGASIAVGAIGGFAQAGTRYGVDASGLDVYQQGVASSLSQSSLRILDRYLSVLPTITIREGHRLKILLADDLLLPAYDDHRMPGDL